LRILIVIEKVFPQDKVMIHLMAVLLTSVFTQGASCFSYEKSVAQTKQVTQVYQSERYTVSVYKGGWSRFDAESGAWGAADTVHKTYMIGGGAGASSVESMTSGMPIDLNVHSEGKKATGKSRTIAGVKCKEFLTEMDVGVGMKGLPPAMMKSMKQFKQEILTCESDSGPAAYLAVLKAQAARFIKVLPSAVRAKIGPSPKLNPLVLYEKRGSKYGGSEAPGSKIETQLGKFGTLCPPSQYLKDPSGYRKIKLTR
jgi:hypothetical protein